MGTVQKVTVSLPKKDAELFKKLSPDERTLFVKILSSWLNNEKLDSKAIMDFISYRAQKKGLTPEILEQILREENP
jgi:hypothetical protein